MLHFIISVILAIILFSIAFGMVAKVFSLSDQAKDSFNDLVNEINQFADSTRESTSKLLIMDADTIVTAFMPGETVYVYEDLSDPLPFVPSETRHVYFPQPKECNDEACLCLCRDTRDERNLVKVRRNDKVHLGTPFSEAIYEITCAKLLCKETPKLGESWKKQRKQEDPRRSTITLTKQGDKVVLE